MMTSLYMINPRPRSKNIDSADGFINVPDLAIVTVAAMAPPHWEVSVCEEEVGPADLESPARFIGLTGKTAQYHGIVRLAEAYRARGKTVLIGGPLASLDPDAVRPHADILVTGEMEDIAPQLFAELEAGTWRDHYDGGRPDLRASPAPRWDLYPVERALMGALQTTRGCPFECEFCDVIQYNGRKQRHKDEAQILRELDALHAAGFRQVFLTDDNFTVHRRFARGTLDLLARWNDQHAVDPIRFVTQLSIDVARDEDLLQRCVRAGLDHVFVGIETVNAESLRETRKRQNLLMPTLESVERIVSHGMLVRCGIMVGFDHDGPDIFDILFDFLQSAPLPIPGINTLVASKGTPLRARLLGEGRLVDEDQRWDEQMVSNVVPKLMTNKDLRRGALQLALRLFEPDAFEQRMMRFIAVFGTAAPEASGDARTGRSATGPRGAYAMSCLRRLSQRDPASAAMVSRVLNAAARKSGVLRSAITCLIFYEQYRSYYTDVDERIGVAA